MSDHKPDLNKTEMRQGNSRKMNSHVLIIGIIAIVVLFVAVYWFSTATYDDTETTTDGGTSIEETSAGDDSDIEELPTPAPVEDDTTETTEPVTPAEPAAQ